LGQGPRRRRDGEGREGGREKGRMFGHLTTTITTTTTTTTTTHIDVGGGMNHLIAVLMVQLCRRDDRFDQCIG